MHPPPPRAPLVLSILLACSGSTDSTAGTTTATDPTTSGGASTGGESESTGATSSTTGSGGSSSSGGSDTTTSSGGDTTTTSASTDTSTSTSADTSTGASGDTTTDTGGPITIECGVDAWDLGADMAWKQEWMATCMVPTIAPILQGIDPLLYADFTCTHCHGADLGGGSYAMPATKPLNFAMPETWDPKYFNKNDLPDTPMFKVMQSAGDLLGYPPYDPNNPESFGCGGCHVML